MSASYRYFVEGECEKKFLKAFMYDKECFQQGKIEIINFINERISKSFVRTLSKETKVVIVFDTDVKNVDNLEYNLALIKKVSFLPDDHIILVPSIKTFEDELVYSCESISNINQLFSTKGVKEFKNKFINHKDIVSKLESSKLSLEKMWSRQPNKPFDKYMNNCAAIKKNIKKE